MAETYTYDRNSIERYLQGKMTPPEMHAFEKAMLDDPFLADAMEGYKASNPTISERHLAEIEKQLTTEKHDAIVVPMATKGKGWLQIAAAVLIVVTGSIFSYQYFQKDISTGSDQQFAMEENGSSEKIISDTFSTSLSSPEQNPADEQPAIALNNRIAKTTPLNENLVTKPGIAEEDNQEGKASQQPGYIEDDRKEEMMKAEMAKSRSASESRSMADENMADTKMAASKVATMAQQPIKGIVTNNDGEPVPYAAIKPVNTGSGTTTDSKGNFTIIAKDSVVDVNVSGVGYASKRAKLMGNSDNNKIVLTEENQSLSEVVVTGFGTVRNSKASKEQTVIFPADKVAAPVIGWGRFNTFVKSKLLEARDSLPKVAASSIFIEFDIDDLGKPYNITLTENSHPSYALFINRILTNGPRWKKIRENEKVKLEIKLR